MTWLLLVLGGLGPAIVGEFADQQECEKYAHEFFALLHEEHQGYAKWRSPPVMCVGVPDAFPEPSHERRL